MSRKSEQEWSDLIVEAARLGQPISKFCDERSLSKNMFYRKAARLGFTVGGVRTDKWWAARWGALFHASEHD